VSHGTEAFGESWGFSNLDFGDIKPVKFFLRRR
jgi:hypothetical protein